MKRAVTISALVLAIIVIWAPQLWADCPLAHTHIGKNPTWRPDWSDPGNPDLATDPDPTDDDQLWFFSLPPVHSGATPGWPNWGDPAEDPFLLLVPEEDPMGDPISKPGDPSKIMYTCRFTYSQENGYGDPEGVQHLDGWHSAHGPQGMWNLESQDQSTVPLWDIRLQRVAASIAEDDFFMLLPSGTPVLTTDGSEYQLPKEWLEDKSAWGIHEHMSFNFWLAADGSDEGSEVSATFGAYDAGGLYTPADPFGFRFTPVPEPATLSLLALGLIALAGRQRH